MKRGLLFRDSSKAQAAMEFLMTYGWALLVVLVAIGALAFFGVLNPGQFLPDQCAMFAGISCTAYQASVTGNELKFTFQNGLGYTTATNSATFGVRLVTAPVTGGADLAGTGASPCTTAFTFTDGTTKTCSYSYTASVAPAPPNGGGTLVQGTKVKGTITAKWTDPSGNLRTRTGSFSLTAEGP